MLVFHKVKYSVLIGKHSVAGLPFKQLNVRQLKLILKKPVIDKRVRIPS